MSLSQRQRAWRVNVVNAEPVTVRRATLTDVPYIVALHKRNSDALGFIPTAAYEHIITGEDGQQNCRLWLADVNGDTVGFAYATPGKLAGHATIVQACIQQDARRLEYGRALTDTVEAWAVGLQRSGVMCGVGTDLDSRVFWDALGYRVHAVVHRGDRRGRLVERRYKALPCGLLMDSTGPAAAPAGGASDAPAQRGHDSAEVTR